MALMSCQSGPEVAVRPNRKVQDWGSDATWRKTWLGLGETHNTCEEVFDYHPTGGMLVTYCHMLSIVGWDRVLAEAPRPIFLAGPHPEGTLDHQNPTTFGHYNPEFVRWLHHQLIPAARDAAFREQTQPLYDQFLQPLARIFYLTHEKLARDPRSCMTQELREYQAAMARAEQYYYERWFFFMNDAFCAHAGDPNYFYNNGFDGGVDGNVVKSAVGFWLRRELDGTRALFFDALVTLLESYDGAWLKNPTR
jgi:hypothetical protein